MAHAPDNSGSFMVEGVLVERWKLYLLRFLLVLLIMPTTAAVFELPKGTVIRLIVEGFLTALTISAVFWWADRQGPTTND